MRSPVPTYNYRCFLQEKRLRETIHLYSDFFSLVFLHLSIVFNCHRVADKLLQLNFCHYVLGAPKAFLSSAGLCQFFFFRSQVVFFFFFFASFFVYNSCRPEILSQFRVGKVIFFLKTFFQADLQARIAEEQSRSEASSGALAHLDGLPGNTCSSCQCSKKKGTKYLYGIYVKNYRKKICLRKTVSPKYFTLKTRFNLPLCVALK